MGVAASGGLPAGRAAGGWVAPRRRCRLGPAAGWWRRYRLAATEDPALRDPDRDRDHEHGSPRPAQEPGAARPCSRAGRRRRPRPGGAARPRRPTCAEGSPLGGQLVELGVGLGGPARDARSAARQRARRGPRGRGRPARPRGRGRSPRARARPRDPAASRAQRSLIAGPPQLLDHSVQPGAGVRLRDPDHRGDLGVGEPGEELERHQLALAGRQLGDRGAERRSADRHLGALLGADRRLVDGLGDQRRLAPAPAQLVERRVAGDPEQPGAPRSPLRVEASAPPVGALEGQCGDVLGGRAVAQQPGRRRRRRRRDFAGRAPRRRRPRRSAFRSPRRRRSRSRP